MPQVLSTFPRQGDDLADRLRHATLGRYDVYAELGRGGMAAVYLALDLALNRKVALKVMLPEVVQGHGAYERFRREARTAASLSHPHIIPVYAVGEDETLAWFAMKYVDGRPLDSVLADDGPQDPVFVQTMLRQMGSALDYAHRRGVTHRDIKPSNILLDEGGWFILSDFGIAKTSDDVALTSSGMLIGTPAYMSPEHFEGVAVGPPADQYALGCVAYELLAGTKLFSSATVAGLMRAHMLEQPAAIDTIRRDCPRTLSAVIARALQKDPAQRFASADDLVHALEAPSPEQQREVTTHITRLARSGMDSRPRISQPVSPVPTNRRAIGQANAPMPAGASDGAADGRSVGAWRVLSPRSTAVGAVAAVLSAIAVVQWTQRSSGTVVAGPRPPVSAEAALPVPMVAPATPTAAEPPTGGAATVTSSKPAGRDDDPATGSGAADRGQPRMDASSLSTSGRRSVESTEIVRGVRPASSRAVVPTVSPAPTDLPAIDTVSPPPATPAPSMSWFSVKLLFADLTLYVDGRLQRVEKLRTIVVPLTPGRHTIEVRRNECPTPFVDVRDFIAGDTVRYNNKGPCPEG